MLPLAVLAMATVALQAVSSTGPRTNLTGSRRLFLDDRHVHTSSGGVERTFHAFARDSAPFFSLEPDENSALGASGVFPYHSVVPPSGASGLWRLYYDCWRDVWGVCLATSTDGTTWSRPRLGKVAFVDVPAGVSEPGNVVLARRSSSHVHGPIPPHAKCTAVRVINASFPGPHRPHPSCQDTSPSLVHTPWDLAAPYKLMTCVLRALLPFAARASLCPFPFVPPPHPPPSLTRERGATQRASLRSDDELPRARAIVSFNIAWGVGAGAGAGGSHPRFNYGYGHPDATGPSVDGYYSSSSVDGTTFVDDTASNPVLPTHQPRNPGDLGHFGYDYNGRGRYLLSARQRMNDSAVAYCRTQHPPECRCIGWATSTDYRRWPQPRPVLCADAVDDRWVLNTSSTNHTELYNMPVFAYEGVYVGLAWVARFGGPSSLNGTAHNNVGSIHVELAFSVDAEAWRRPPGSVGARHVRPQLIPRGPPGSWDSGMVMTSNTPFAATDAEGRDILRLSYFGCPFLHSLAPKPWRPCSIGWAAMRRDGFASLGPAPRTTASANASSTVAATVTTVPLGPSAANATVIVNYAAGPGGWLRVSLLARPGGATLAGYGLAACTRLAGNSTGAAVRWAAQSRLPGGEQVAAAAALHFAMQGDVQLYSFDLVAN